MAHKHKAESLVKMHLDDEAWHRVTVEQTPFWDEVRFTNYTCRFVILHCPKNAPHTLVTCPSTTLDCNLWSKARR